MSTDTTPTFREQFHDLAAWLRTPKGLLFAGIAILLVIGMIGSAFDSGEDAPAPTTPTTTETSPSPGYARAICERAVKDQLVSPSTAKFGRPSITGSGRTLDVVGHVDAENRFGGTIRADYDCRVTGIGDNLTVQNIQIYEN